MARRLLLTALLMSCKQTASGGGDVSTECGTSHRCGEDQFCREAHCVDRCDTDEDCSGELCLGGGCTPLQQPCDPAAAIEEACALANRCQTILGASCDCNDGDECFCVYQPDIGKPCNDHDLCTSLDACDSAATCHGTPIDCGEPQDASCDEANDTFTQWTYPACDWLTGECVTTVLESDCANCAEDCLLACEGLDCTPTDSCVSQGICESTESGAACSYTIVDDGAACTIPGTPGIGHCEAGACVIVDCDSNDDCEDNNPCSLDLCNGTVCDNSQATGAGLECRAAAGDCDLAETCDGLSPTCPDDDLVPEDEPCRDAAGPCDLAETCDGLSPLCPDDVLVAEDEVCRGQAGMCDVVERCDGDHVTCPTDVYAFSGTVCSPSSCDPAAQDCCDVDDTCTGDQPDCPQKFDPGKECRPSNTVCDQGESCTGSDPTCPADSPAAPGTVCHAGTDPTCDPTIHCLGQACPMVPPPGSEVICIDAQGVCTYPDVCDGGGHCLSGPWVCPER